MDDAVLRGTERWFIQRGLPHFIADYNASQDIWTRALPTLTLLFLVEVVALAPNSDFPILSNTLVVIGVLAVVLGGWALVNRGRRRPLLARPNHVGSPELIAFVVVPALVPLVLGGQTRQSIGIALFNVVLLGAIYLFTSYGVLAMTRWGLGRLLQQLEAVVSLLARALPMMALLVAFIFLTAEVWQSAGTVHGLTYVILAGLFPLIGILFLTTRLPRDIGELNHFDSVEQMQPLLDDTPMQPARVELDPDDVPGLSRREWGNVGLVALFSQGVQIAIVTLLIGVFFVVLGVLLVSEETTLSWAGQVNVLVSFSFGQRELVITEQLLRVAGFVMAFAGLNYTVVLLTDQTYRTEFREEVVAELRQSFAVRAAYLALRGSIISPT
jgi:hypothetical protein